MLLDALMPVYDVAEHHQTVVRAEPATVFAAIKSFDLSNSPVTRVLLFARAVPAILGALVRSPRDVLAESRLRRAELRFADFERAGFKVVAERAPEELVIGALGKFWKVRSALRMDMSAAHFASGPPPGYALAGWNFTVEPRHDGTSQLRTETRVWCAPEVRAKFRVYWLVIRPGSGLIRREILRVIRREAESR
ncbi:MAG TPA: hypothetical protein VGJ18_25755 [Gemmatimonadaceae bacterium]|jgi:hypothetical protein